MGRGRGPRRLEAERQDGVLASPAVLDADIRRALHAEIRVLNPDAKIIDELGLRQGQVRADAAVVSDVLHGYEIKSQADTLRRLPEQARVYSRVFDYATIVVAMCHLSEAGLVVPNWWGLVVAVGCAGSVELAPIREAKANPSVDKRALAELLWHDDAMALLRRKGEHRGLSGKPRRAAWDRVAEVCSLDEVRGEVRTRLKARAELWAERGRGARIG